MKQESQKSKLDMINLTEQQRSVKDEGSRKEVFSNLQSALSTTSGDQVTSGKSIGTSKPHTSL